MLAAAKPNARFSNSSDPKNSVLVFWESLRLESVAWSAWIHAVTFFSLSDHSQKQFVLLQILKMRMLRDLP